MRQEVQDARDDPGIPAPVAALADQLEAALMTGRGPAIWTPSFAHGCQLLAVVLEVHRVFSQLFPVLAGEVQELRGLDVIRVCNRTSREIQSALNFLRGHPAGRIRLTGVGPGIRRVDLLQIAHGVLTYSPAEALHRVRQFAISSNAFEVAFRELRRRDARIGTNDPALAAMALATDILPRAQPWAFEGFQRLAGIHPRRDQPSPGDRDQPTDHGLPGEDEIRAEIYQAAGELVALLRELGPDGVYGKVLDGDPQVKYLPHAAKMDALNWWEKQHTLLRIPARMEDEAGSLDALAARVRHALEHSDPESVRWGPADPKVKRAEEILQAKAYADLAERENDPEALAQRRAEFLRNPPASFLTDLTEKERTAFDALRRLRETQQLSADWGLQRKLAKEAQVSDSTVTRLFEKIRKALSVTA